MKQLLACLLLSAIVPMTTNAVAQPKVSTSGSCSKAALRQTPNTVFQRATRRITRSLLPRENANPTLRQEGSPVRRQRTPSIEKKLVRS